jgi:hypothetical protein
MMASDHAVLWRGEEPLSLPPRERRAIVNNHPNDVVLVPSVPTPPAAMISSEADTYIGLLIVAVREHDASSQKSATRWAASFVVASLVGAYFLWMLL